MQEKAVRLTQELYIIRAHLLHWSSLLDDLEKTVRFIRDYKNPAMDSPNVTEEERQLSAILLARECDNLDDEINRLEKARNTQGKRVKNAMDLVKTCSMIYEGHANSSFSFRLVVRCLPPLVSTTV